MTRNPKIGLSLDWVSVLLYIALVFIGWLNIYAAVYSEEHSSIFDLSQRYGKQMLWILAAIAMCFMALFIEVKFYLLFANVVYLLSIFMLIIVLIFGKEVNGAKAWIEFGMISIQPTEFAKIGVSLAIARYISSYNIRLNQLRPIVTILAITFFPTLFILLQPDIGSIIVFLSFFIAFYREGLPGEYLVFGIVLIVLFILALLVSNIALLVTVTVLSLVGIGLSLKKGKYSIIGILSISLLTYIFYIINRFFGFKIDEIYIFLIPIVIVSIYLFVASFLERAPQMARFIMFLWIAVAFTFSVNYVFNNIMEPHQQERVEILLGKKSDPRGAEYNVNQSKIAIGSGGIWGKGFLQGTQTKYNFVPEQSTDFIFCTIGEEWGFIGSIIVLFLYAALILRLLFLSERQKSTFSRVYGYCVAGIFFMHVVVNIGMTIGILPVIGIPLPFMSYGGSSLWGFTILLFIFLRLDVSRLEMLR